MIRIASALLIASFGFLAASCCCTSDSEAPPLRPLPKFREIGQPEPEVDYSK